MAKAPQSPSVALVISAYNEQDVIAAKIENSLALDYKKGQLSIIVVSDGSCDGTDEIVESFAKRATRYPVRLHRMAVRGGKTVGLNSVVASSLSEVIVFSDANAMYQADAIRKLVQNFADEEVGAVTGASTYTLGANDPSTRSEITYWSYETWLKSLESELGSLIGGDGAIYAIRRELYGEMAPDDQSDLVNPLEIVSQGFRNVFEASAISYEGGADGYPAEFRRKVRIINQAWLATWKLKRLLNPWRYGILSLQLLSHKILRWLVPWMLVLLAAATLIIFNRSVVYHYALVGQVALYVGAIAGWALLRFRGDPGAIFGVPYYFVLVNAASAWALMEAIGGTRYATWTVSRQGAA